MPKKFDAGLLRWGEGQCAGIAAAALFIALCAPLACSFVGDRAQPNVVLIVVDSLRRDRLSVYGHHRSTSRNIDSLAQAGVRYDRAYATAPWTTPSVASILSSRLASNIGIRRGRTALPDELELLSELLKRKGYHTGLCVFADAAAWPVQSYIEKFRGEFEEYISSEAAYA